MKTTLDIIIKSFNRPYYLERCIRSIYLFVKGNFTIKVLDDGTPPEYLKHIQSLFPEVILYRSPEYDKKAKAINDHVTGRSKYNLSSIPSLFWVDVISKSTDIFFLLEDDIWLTQEIDLDDVEQGMHEKNVVLTKTYWANNKYFVSGQKEQLSTSLELYIPNISRLQIAIFQNEWKLRSILYRLKLFTVDLKFLLPFYDLYSVASAFYKKEYWLYLWQDSSNKVEETYQLTRALQWRKNNESGFAKTINEVTTTSFITSATNMFSGVDLEIFHFNHHLNQAWINGKLDSMENFPKDFSIPYISEFLRDSNDNNCKPEEWHKWITHFKGIYVPLGFDVN